MKSFIFPFYMSFGKLDSTSGEIEFALSDKNAARLERSAKEGRRFRLNEDDDISDIYARVLDAIIREDKKAMLSNPSFIEDALSWYDEYDPEGPVSKELLDRYYDDITIGINYPEHLQNLKQTVKKRRRQSKCESVIVSRDDVQDYLRKNENQNKVVYVDEGKTLYYIPKYYSGKFIVSEKAEKIYHRAFPHHSGITEVVLQDGITVLSDWQFMDCRSLKKVTIPSTVKVIEDFAFVYCTSLSMVELSEGLLRIDNAFNGCVHLTELRVPVSVKTISPYIADSYNCLKDIYFLGMDTTIDGEPGNKMRGGITMHVKKGSKAHKYAKKYRLKHVIEDA